MISASWFSWLKRRGSSTPRRREPDAADMGTAFGMEISLIPDSTLEHEATHARGDKPAAAMSRPMYLIHPGA